MKRAIPMTQLHMGCGEGLTGRIRLASPRKGLFALGAVKRVHDKAGKGKR